MEQTRYIKTLFQRCDRFFVFFYKLDNVKFKKPLPDTTKNA